MATMLALEVLALEVLAGGGATEEVPLVVAAAAAAAAEAAAAAAHRWLALSCESERRRLQSAMMRMTSFAMERKRRSRLRHMSAQTARRHGARAAGAHCDSGPLRWTAALGRTQLHTHPMLWSSFATRSQLHWHSSSLIHSAQTMALQDAWPAGLAPSRVPQLEARWVQLTL